VPPAARAIELEEAVAMALANSPDVAAANHRIAAARAAILEARSGFLPAVSVSQSYTASNNPVRAFMMTLNQRAFDFADTDFNHPGTVDNFATRLIGRWRLYDGGRDAAGHDAAELAAEAAEANLAAVRNTLVFEVTRAYYETLKARRFVATAEAAVADRENNLALAESLRDEGAALETDALDADVALAAARADLISARSARAVAEAILTSVVGARGNERLTAAEVAGEAVDLATEGDLTGLDYRQRPELVSADKLVEAAEKRLRAARAGWLPRLSAFGGYNLDSGDFDDFADSWAAGASVELDLFEGGRTQGAIARAQAELSAAEAERRRIELRMELDWRRSRQAVEESAARVRATAKAAHQAERSLRITRERYREGLALFARVLSSETALADARQRRSAAVYDYHIARAALERAGGRDAGTAPAGADLTPSPAAPTEGTE
jgi:outer membrane protein TolC